MLNKLERCHSRYSISHTTRQILKKKCLNVEYDIRPIRCWVGLISFDLTFS